VPTTETIARSGFVQVIDRDAFDVARSPLGQLAVFGDACPGWVGAYDGATRSYHALAPDHATSGVRIDAPTVTELVRRVRAFGGGR
jgi:hypothetical protein